jgi:hypothetical protein
MLAPRKTLWSTPDRVVATAIDWVPLHTHSSDKVCDIGCGDGRVILQWVESYSQTIAAASAALEQKQQQYSELSLSANQRGAGRDEESSPSNKKGTNNSNSNTSTSTTNLPSFVGIDIDSDRIAQARQHLQRARARGRVDPRLSVTFHCANAMQASELFADATVIFLYLIPRGLRLVQHDVSQPAANNTEVRPRHVITYMSPLPNQSPVRTELISDIPHQPGAAWPLYLYRFEQK